MRFVDCVDYGDAKVEIITGLAMVVETDTDHVEVIHYLAHVMPDGSMENRIVSRQRWSKRDLAQARMLLEGALAAFARQGEARPCAAVAVMH
jgi:hypothetical protein